MKIELKQIVLYLPYRINYYSPAVECRGIFSFSKEATIEVMDILSMKNISDDSDSDLKPILRPLSDLDKMITHKGVSFRPIDEFFILLGGAVPNDKKAIDNWKRNFIDNISYSPIEKIDYFTVQKLAEYHFDVFRFIPENLAIDINTLKK